MSALAPRRLYRATSPALVVCPIDACAARLGMRGERPQPIGPLRFFIRQRLSSRGSAPEGGAPLVRLDMCRNPTGHFIFFNTVTSADGIRRQPYFSPGRYELQVEGDFYQTLVVPDVDLPHGSAALEVRMQPGYRYQFTQVRQPGNGNLTLLRGRVAAADGSGVADALVEVEDSDPPARYMTDGSGQFVFVFPEFRADRDCAVRVTVPGQPEPWVADVRVKAGQSTSLHLTRMRGRVIDKAGQGIAGVKLSVRGLNGATLSDALGEWSYTFPLGHPRGRAQVAAVLPNGKTLQSSVKVVAGALSDGPVFTA